MAAIKIEGGGGIVATILTIAIITILTITIITIITLTIITILTIASITVTIITYQGSGNLSTTLASKQICFFLYQHNFKICYGLFCAMDQGVLETPWRASRNRRCHFPYCPNPPPPPLKDKDNSDDRDEDKDKDNDVLDHRQRSWLVLDCVTLVSGCLRLTQQSPPLYYTVSWHRFFQTD